MTLLTFLGCSSGSPPSWALQGDWKNLVTVSVVFQANRMHRVCHQWNPKCPRHPDIEQLVHLNLTESANAMCAQMGHFDTNGLWTEGGGIWSNFWATPLNLPGQPSASRMSHSLTSWQPNDTPLSTTHHHGCHHCHARQSTLSSA